MPPDALPPLTRAFGILYHRVKAWLQSIKKVYGCVAWSPEQSWSRSRFSDERHTCWWLDADSHFTTQSKGLCHAASRYTSRFPKQTVFVTKYPHKNHTKHDRVVELSRELLGGPVGQDFGEFWAMEWYVLGHVPTARVRASVVNLISA